MKKIILVLMSAMTLGLAACGGGSSSSSDSSSGDRFSGVQTITILGESEQAGFVMTVSGSTVTIRDEDFTASGALNSNGRFSVTVPPFALSVDGISCTFNLVYTGTISGNSTSGNLSGSATCLGTRFAITGTFAANKGNSKQLVNSLSDVVLSLVK